MAAHSGSHSRGTILMVKGFNPTHDAERLKDWMDGTGSNDKGIIDILGHRINSQRQEIKKAYTKLYHREEDPYGPKSLEQDLKDELDGEFETLILALMTSTDDYDAQLIYKATKGSCEGGSGEGGLFTYSTLLSVTGVGDITGLGTDDDLLAEVLCTRTKMEVQKIKEAYLHRYKADMVEIIKDDTSGDWWKLCETLLARGGAHESGSHADRKEARKDAETLFHSGEGKLGRDAEVFIDILTGRSYAQLNAVFNEYERATEEGHTMEEAVESQFSGDIRMGLLTLVRTARCTPRYFAEKLHKALTGWHDHDTTIRIVVSRAEIDLDDIKVEFMKLYRKTLSNCVEEEIRGPYRRMLLEIIRY